MTHTITYAGVVSGVMKGDRMFLNDEQTCWIYCKSNRTYPFHWVATIAFTIYKEEMRYQDKRFTSKTGKLIDFILQKLSNWSTMLPKVFCK